MKLHYRKYTVIIPARNFTVFLHVFSISDREHLRGLNFIQIHLFLFFRFAICYFRIVSSES